MNFATHRRIYIPDLANARCFVHLATPRRIYFNLQYPEANPNKANPLNLRLKPKPTSENFQSLSITMNDKLKNTFFNFSSYNSLKKFKFPKKKVHGNKDRSILVEISLNKSEKIEILLTAKDVNQKL